MNDKPIHHSSFASAEHACVKGNYSAVRRRTTNDVDEILLKREVSNLARLTPEEARVIIELLEASLAHPPMLP